MSDVRANYVSLLLAELKRLRAEVSRYREFDGAKVRINGGETATLGEYVRRQGGETTTFGHPTGGQMARFAEREDALLRDGAEAIVEGKSAGTVAEALRTVNDWAERTAADFRPAWCAAVVQEPEPHFCGNTTYPCALHPITQARSIFRHDAFGHTPRCTAAECHE